MAGEFHLRLISPERTVIDRPVRAVSFMGLDGSYGILANHAPMITATPEASVLKITQTDGKVDEIFIADGVVEMHGNELRVLCRSSERAGEIDLARAKEAEQRAREKIAEAEKSVPGVDLPRAQAALQRAMLRQLLRGRGSIDTDMS